METTGTQYLPSDYLPILIQFAAALGFVIFALVVTHLLGPKRKSEVKGASWESGVESVGDARTPISYKYFITAILFVLFDIEIIFMYPWAVNFREFGLEGFLPMMLFLGVILAGFFYEIKKGILK
ncbi:MULTISPECIES: NADH-quinone oxidoreductase subunit A [Pontibacter]|jgi:NADH-quinone oxidoreductase subunit A|uniref:NADH-quinone oxidoreductase subunit n=1 Tax=Pontibacter lucknowensis TaxID=1077936 RepID=A0A1N7AA19_9BACT|nr:MULTISPECIES: NADH-quinone oxidoreductase subunit A [Pontibacter]EJF10407.1 NADH-ubiquinone/plastoquinone oxidoreductase chain 3 [Pontibacter sp. BAB1700]SIR35844.1 NADH dehydrogenase subunit A [Pontibacter lucknowensis]